MKFLTHIFSLKVWLCIIAILIASVSIIVSNRLTSRLAEEERKRVEIWGDAMSSLLQANENTDLSLILKIMNSNTTIPVIVLDADDKVLEHRNLPFSSEDSLRIQEEAQRMRARGSYMKTTFTADNLTTGAAKPTSLYICYGESINLQRLALYPYIQLGIVGLFVIVAVIALLNSKRAEQNRVWVGLSKETAHQLGTPISSLMAWSEMLQETYPDNPLLPEMEKDVHRLKLIADRFSKIGSVPELSTVNLNDIIEEAVEYMKRRVPRQVSVVFSHPETPVFVRANRQLLEWVVENIMKNGLDAITTGTGTLGVRLSVEDCFATVALSDTGKGIPKKDFKKVFRPGFTTKKRGWGLGLSLAKRIISEYHHGRIFVRSSEVGKGTTICFTLRTIED